ncbi:MAG TPA: hypothetical protein VIQ80_01565 [Candidatus Saccharimonadales bacterium]
MPQVFRILWNENLAFLEGELKNPLTSEIGSNPYQMVAYVLLSAIKEGKGFTVDDAIVFVRLTLSGTRAYSDRELERAFDTVVPLLESAAPGSIMTLRWS